MQKEIVFVTHNKGKVISAQKYFDGKNIKLEIFNYDLDEPRSDDVKTIAKAKVLQAYNLVKKPCFALDTGFFIEALNGFPRAFVNFTLDTIGIQGILKLMNDEKDRNCHFKECLAYTEDGVNIKYFYAKQPGLLSKEILGKNTDKKWSELWYIFKPEGYDITLAEMTDEQRDKRTKKREENHEISAIGQLANWL